MFHALFGKKHSSGPRSANYAEEALELESRLDQRCTLETLKRLVEMYSRAIEHYSAANKHVVYQQRLAVLLARPEVLALLESKPHFKLPNSNELELTRATESAVKHHLVQTSQTFKRLQTNLQHQQTSLLRRVRTRAQRKSVQLDENVENVENEIQSVLEDFVTKKFEAKAAIEAKYQEHFTDVKAIADTALAGRVLKQLNTHMLREVQLETARLHAAKEEQIFAIKQRLT